MTTALGFDAFVDGAAMLNLENLEGVTIFGFVNPADMAKLRKALKDDLKYVEAYAKQGYVGTVGGINIYTKKNAETGKVVIATKEAVTLFNKKGTEVEQEREGNIRRNTVYSRKYYLAAMTNEAKAVKPLSQRMKLLPLPRPTMPSPVLAMSRLRPVRMTTPRPRVGTKSRRRKKGGEPRCVIKRLQC